MKIMCGIAGFIDPSLTPSRGDDQLEKMLHAISHRGPDARGKLAEPPLALGHNRLSIIDLSAEGNQPMEYFDSIITYNGEIYNYIELRERLKERGYHFRTQSDTEVILASYREWGSRCTEHFMGMWAFALWDKKEKHLFCSRDRFGIKPFYYIHTGNSFYFASEIKALKISPLFSANLNEKQISRGLQLGWTGYNDETYFEKVKSLPAASNLIFLNGSCKISCFWEANLSNKFSGSFDEKKKKFFSLFTDSIRLHMRSDVEVGGCLSGGLDSSSISSAIGTYFSTVPFKTFSVYYRGNDEVDERPWVKQVLGKYGNLVPHYFSPADDEIEEAFHKTLFHSDVPVASSSPLSQYFLMKLAAANKIKVVLDGQGADEYLGGYMHSFYRLIAGLLRMFNFTEAIRQWNRHCEVQNFKTAKSFDVLAKSFLSFLFSEQQLYTMEYRNYFPFLYYTYRSSFTLKETGGTKLNNFLYQLVKSTSLPALLHYEDRNSMAFSIESRVPFLDHRLVEFVFSLRDSDKMNDGITKVILRESLKEILPDVTVNRTDKKGFVTPGEIRWLRGPLMHITSQVKPDDFPEFLNRKKLNDIMTEYRKGSNAKALFVWRIVCLHYWLKNFAA